MKSTAASSVALVLFLPLPPSSLLDLFYYSFLSFLLLLCLFITSLIFPQLFKVSHPFPFSHHLCFLFRLVLYLFSSLFFHLAKFMRISNLSLVLRCSRYHSNPCACSCTVQQCARKKASIHFVFYSSLHFHITVERPPTHWYVCVQLIRRCVGWHVYTCVFSSGVRYVTSGMCRHICVNLL